MPQFSFDQVVDILVCGVVQGIILAGRPEERFNLFLCVRVKAGDVIGFMVLGAVEVFVVFRFISSHD